VYRKMHWTIHRDSDAPNSWKDEARFSLALIDAFFGTLLRRIPMLD
jgi:hypothetical protein